MLKSFFVAINDYLFGYDFFISYAHADGTHYPAELYAKLKSLGYKVFLDTSEYPAGTDLKSATTRRVKGSSHLIVIGGKNAFQSEWVKKEIQQFIKKEKQPILINIEKVFDKTPNGNPIAHLLKNRIFIDEKSFPSPSSVTIEKVSQSFNSVRRETLRLRVISIVSLILVAVTIIAIWQSTLANKSKTLALERERESNEAFEKEALERKRADSLMLLEQNARLQEMIQRKKVDSMLQVVIKERNDALESFAQKELAEIELLKNSPTNEIRNKKLADLYDEVKPIRDKAIFVRITELIDKIPSKKSLVFENEFSEDIIDYYVDELEKTLVVVLSHSVEFWDLEKFELIESLKLKDQFNDRAQGKIIWSKYDVCNKEIFIEVVYGYFAFKGYNDQIECRGLDVDFRCYFWDKEILEPEKELFSIDFIARSISLVGITQHVILFDRFKSFNNKEEFIYRTKSKIDLEDFIEVATGNDEYDYSEKVKSLVPDYANDQMNQYFSSLEPFIDKITDTPCTSLGIYQASQIAVSMPIAGPPPVTRIPFVFDGSDSLIQIFRMISQQERNIMSERGFTPAALNLSEGFALLNDRLIEFGDFGYREVLQLPMNMYKVSSAYFSSDATKIILVKKNNDVEVFDRRTGSVNTLLSINSFDKKCSIVSNSGGFVFIFRSSKSTIQAWKIDAFANDGWALVE